MSVKQQLCPLVVDHAYVWVSKGGQAMDALRNIGLTPKATIGIHEGEGTASHVIFFQNMYLELLWIEDQAELDAYLSTGGDVLPVYETWKETGVSPFGVGFHYRTPDTKHLPIETLHHQAQWMPEDSYIQSIRQTSFYIPDFFILHGSLAYWESRMGNTVHNLGVEELTGLQITATTLENPDTLSPYLSEHNVITLKQGNYPLMELTFDHQRQGKTFDLRPTLPLIINC